MYNLVKIKILIDFFIIHECKSLFATDGLQIRYVVNICTFLNGGQLFSYVYRRQHLAGKEASKTSLRREVTL